MELPPFRYRALLCLLSPCIVVLILLQALKYRSRRFAYQRLGFGYFTYNYCGKGSGKESGTRPVWIHCASVGEATAALPLIQKLLQQQPDRPMVVSTTTPTGAATVARWKLANVQHQYLPVDFKSAVRRAVTATAPVVLIVMETEIWPTLLSICAAHRIPVVVANGRVGDRTLNSPAWMQLVYLRALGMVDKILAKSEEDKERFLKLGGTRVKVTGNIKFAAVPAESSQIECDIKRPFWLLASTHDDEEQQICRYLNDYPACAGRLLVIAPRHPDRSHRLQQMLKQSGLLYAVRSKGQSVSENTQVYLADQLGEMMMWFSHAEVAFMGGSLVPVGGHNLLEPAAAGVPVVCGAHLHNFSEEAELLLSAGAMVTCATAAEVMQQISDLLGDSGRRQSMGRAGREALAGKSNVADRYLEELLPYITTD